MEWKLLNEAPQGLIPIKWIRFIDDTFAIGPMTFKNSRDSYHTLTTSTPQLNVTTHAHKNQSTSLTQLFTSIPTTNSNETYKSNQLI